MRWSSLSLISSVIKTFYHLPLAPPPPLIPPPKPPKPPPPPRCPPPNQGGCPSFQVLFLYVFDTQKSNNRPNKVIIKIPLSDQKNTPPKIAPKIPPNHQDLLGAKSLIP